MLLLSQMIPKVAFDGHAARLTGACGESRKARGQTYRKVVFNPDGEKLVGVLFAGDITNAGMYRYLIRENRQIAKIKSHIIDQTLHYGHFLKD